jgi:hypothetical protein
LLAADAAQAQNWSFDARTIALGGVGDVSNVARDMVDEQRQYRAIVLPFGLLQVLPNLGELDPTEDDFDLVRTIEYAASPIHYVIGRDDSSSGQLFVRDIRNAELNRDLNVYRVLTLPTDIAAEGLASPSYGKTFKFHQTGDGAFQGIFVGAGPYLSMQTAATIEPALTDLLASETPVYVRNSRFLLTNDTLSQAALAITGGYRARIAWAPGVGGGGMTEGLYIGANYHFLKGFRYEDFDLSARLDTDNAGLLTVNPTTQPITINRLTATDGRGFAVDVGVAAVIKRWEFGVGVNGIANRIDWTSVERRGYFLASLISGGDFVELPITGAPDSQVELPVDVRASAALNADVFTATAEFGRGYNGTTVRGGYEHRFDRVQLRGGGRYVRERFEPTGGVGFEFSDRVGLDVGLFSTSANLERKRHLAVAASIRLMSRN